MHLGSPVSTYVDHNAKFVRKGVPPHEVFANILLFTTKNY